MVFYLAGSIESFRTKAKPGARQIAPALRNLGHEFYDPTENELKGLTETEATEFRAWKRTDLKGFRQTIQKIIAYDLDLIEHQCDAIVCYWDQYAGRGAGTQGGADLRAPHGHSRLFDLRDAGGADQRMAAGLRHRNFYELRRIQRIHEQQAGRLECLMWIWRRARSHGNS